MAEKGGLQKEIAFSDIEHSFDFNKPDFKQTDNLHHIHASRFLGALQIPLPFHPR